MEGSQMPPAGAGGAMPQPPYPPQTPYPGMPAPYGYGYGAGSMDPLRIVGAGVGALGAILLLVSSFVKWVEPGYKESFFSPPLLFLSLFMLAGLAVALFWKEGKSFAAFSVFLAAAACLVLYFFAAMHLTSPGESLKAGAYLAGFGAPMALLGSLMLYQKSE